MNTVDGDLRRSPESPAAGRALAALAGVAVLVGTVLRFIPRRDLWLDEALSANIAGLPFGDIPGALERDGHPPLYYWLLHAWTTLVPEDDWWLRALSGIIGVAGMPLAWMAGRRLGRRLGAEGLGGRRMGWLALILYCLLPYGVRYGAETRMYALVITLVLAGYLLVDSLLATTTRPDAPRGSPVVPAIGLALVTAALLWTHYWTLWLVGATGVLAVAVAVRATDATLRRSATACAAALVAGGLLFLPWVPTMLYQNEHTGTPWGEVFRPATVLVVTFTDFLGGAFAELQVAMWALVAAIGLALFGLLRQRAGRNVVELGGMPQRRIMTELCVMFLALGIGWAVSWVGGATFASRYAAAVFPLFVLCAAAGLAMIRTTRATFVVALLLSLLLVAGSAYEITSDRTQAGVVADSIATDLAANPGPAVVVACPDQLGPATERALRNAGLDIEVIPYPTSGDPRFVDWVDYEDRNTSSDPATFVAGVLEEAGDDTAVYAVGSTTYLTFEGKCDAVLSGLGAGAEFPQLVQGDAEAFYEPMGLWVRRPSS